MDDLTVSVVFDPVGIVSEIAGCEAARTVVA